MDSILLETTTIDARAELFAALGDPIRLQILDLVAGGTACVCEIQTSIDIAPSLLSYHLKVLKEAGLLESERRGRWVDYRLTRDAARRVDDATPAALQRERGR